MTTPTDLPGSNPNEERPHKPADDREEIYFVGSPALRGELGQLTLCIVIAAALAITPFFFDIPWYVKAIGIVAGICVIVIPLILTWTIRYRISNYRIDFERGILSRSIDTLELWHVEDIRMHQSLLDRILGVGTLYVYSHADRTLNKGELQMHSLPNPRAIFDNLKQRIISVKRQRGVLKIDSADAHTHVDPS